MSKTNDTITCAVLIIGGGAAGLAAAIEAGRLWRDKKTTGLDQAVCLLESQDRVGKKILATGNGRCNLSHSPLFASDYYCSQQDFAAGLLERYGVESTLAWFERLGLYHRQEDDGRIFPYSLQAAAVLDALRFSLTDLPLEVRTGQPVSRLSKQGGGFIAESKDLIVQADTVIVATGGLAGPQFGCDGSGYRLMQSLGHKLIEPWPALVQITVAKEEIGGLAGTKCEAVISLSTGGQEISREEGEILFANYGLSGPPVLQLSRALQQQRLKGNNDRFFVKLDLLPDLNRQTIVDWLKQKRLVNANYELNYLWNSLLPRTIGQWLTRNSIDLKLNLPVCSLSDKQIDKLAGAVKHKRLTVTGTLAWRQAQVTAGGLATADFNPLTLESYLHKGLFAAGELLDVDGRCGGYNLQWAWSSGRCAGIQAAGAALGNSL